MAFATEHGVVLPLELVGTLEADRFFSPFHGSGARALRPSHFAGDPPPIIEAKSGIHCVEPRCLLPIGGIVRQKDGETGSNIRAPPDYVL